MTLLNNQTLTENHPLFPSSSILRSEIKGAVIAPGDPEYDTARTVYAGGIDHRPLVIIRSACTDDVSRAVSLARETGMELSVRSGGHSPVGHGVSDGGIMLDLSMMKDIQIDKDGLSAWAEAGMTAGEYTAAAGAHDLATGFGDTATVGIGGITLGGGFGYLTRKFGLTIDQLLAAEIVTADGKVLLVDSKNHADLFWAIRGGGGNFGVITRFQFRLQRVPAVFGGMLILPADAEVMARFAAEAQRAPDELTTIATAMTAPPMPFLPPEVHGKPIFMISIAYVGDAIAGEAAVAPFRALATPIADMLRPMRYPELFAPSEDTIQALSVSGTFFIDTIDRNAAQVIVDQLKTSSAMLAAVQLRVLGGAVARVPVEETAYAHRKAPIAVFAAAMYQQPGDEALHRAWITSLQETLRPFDDAAYVNFMGKEGIGRARRAYPGANWDRLVAIKRLYDPDNLFHLNMNIPPQESAGNI